MDDTPRADPDSTRELDLESTAELLSRIRRGDAEARNRLVRRYLSILQRWASGRLPARARGLVDTNDLVQVTLLKSLEKVNEFEPRREGAFLAYLRQVLLNQIRDEIRRADRRPRVEELNAQFADSAPSPLEETIGRDFLERYEAALEKLPEAQREAIVLRLEMDFTYRELAAALESPSENAARMFVTRALVKLSEVLDEPA